MIAPVAQQAERESSKLGARSSKLLRRSNRGRTHSTMAVQSAHNRKVPSSRLGGSTIPGSSSTGQSAGLLSRMLGVRVLPARPIRRRERQGEAMVQEVKTARIYVRGPHVTHWFVTLSCGHEQLACACDKPPVRVACYECSKDGQRRKR